MLVLVTQPLAGYGPVPACQPLSRTLGEGRGPGARQGTGISTSLVLVVFRPVQSR